MEMKIKDISRFFFIIIILLMMAVQSLTQETSLMTSLRVENCVFPVHALGENRGKDRQMLLS